MEHIKSKPLLPIVFIPLLVLVFVRPFISGLTYPIAEIYYQNWIIFFAIITLLTNRKGYAGNPYNLPIFLLLVSYCISTATSVNMQNSLKEITKFISYFSIFFIVSLADDRQKKSLIKTIVLVASIISLYSIYQYFWGYQWTLNYLKEIKSDFLSSPYYSSYAKDILIDKRAIGTFPSPNILGGYLVISFFLALQLLFDKDDADTKARLPIHPGLARIIKIIPIVAIIFSLIFTKSLGAWLSLTACLIILYFLSTHLIRYKKLITSIFLISILLITVFIVSNRSDRLINLNNPRNSIIHRIGYWRTSLAVIKDHPFLGIGPGNFQEVFLRYKTGARSDTKYAHNIFLHQWSEAGVLGFASIIFLIITFVKKTASKSKYLLLAGSSLILHNLIDATYFISQVGLFWWIIMGLTVTTDRYQ